MFEQVSEPDVPEPRDAAPAVARDGARRITLLPGRVRIEQGTHARELPLDDPAQPAFLRLPRVDLDDGGSVRRAAFDAWAGHVRASVRAGREFETSYRPARPLTTLLAMAGAAVVVGLCLLLLATWALRPVPTVEVRPTTGETIILLLAVAAVVGVIVVSAAAFVRAWRCRRGSYIALGARGIRTVHAGPFEGFEVVAQAEHHPVLRCTRLVFTDGRPELWVPAEGGALRRPDLLLGALDPRLGDALRESL